MRTAKYTFSRTLIWATCVLVFLVSPIIAQAACRYPGYRAVYHIYRKSGLVGTMVQRLSFSEKKTYRYTASASFHHRNINHSVKEGVYGEIIKKHFLPNFYYFRVKGGYDIDRQFYLPEPKRIIDPMTMRLAIRRDVLKGRRRFSYLVKLKRVPIPFQFRVVQRNVWVKTPLGRLKTVEVNGRGGGWEMRVWLSKKYGYLLVKARIVRYGKLVNELLIQAYSPIKRNCWVAMTRDVIKIAKPLPQGKQL